MKVLLADDHEVVRAGIRKVVEEIADLKVVGEVGDGPSLLKKLAELKPGLLLVDINMPEFDPVNTISQIRTTYPALIVLVVTAYHDDYYVHGLIKSGVNGYHLKEQPLADLKAAIEKVLKGEQWITGSLIPKLVDRNRLRLSATTLTARQRDIVRLLQEGLDNYRIAQEMNLSVKTIENHLTRIYRHLNVQSRLEAVNYANQHPDILGVIGQNMAQNKNIKVSGDIFSILVVDDNAEYLNQIQRVLGKISPQAFLYEADTTILAARIAERTKPNLVLIDVVLGEEDGISCSRRIKMISPDSRIVMISAYPDREFHRLSIEAGAVAFLDKKDLDSSTLRQVVRDFS